jgi:hypothetical protein
LVLLLLLLLLLLLAGDVSEEAVDCLCSGGCALQVLRNAAAQRWRRQAATDCASAAIASCVRSPPASTGIQPLMSGDISGMTMLEQQRRPPVLGAAAAAAAAADGDCCCC